MFASIVSKIKYYPKSLWVFIFLIVILGFGAFFLDLWTKDNFEKIYSGLIVATIIGSITVITDFQYLKYSKLIYDSSLNDIFENRNEKEKYKSIIISAKQEISIMGSSASRFLEDLGKVHSDAELDNLLRNGVKIRICITESEANLGDSTRALMAKYLKIDGFEVRHFSVSDFVPQSIFIVDNICITGPIFTGVDSAHTPALKFKDKHSIYARQFVQYFETVWNHRTTEL